MNKQLILNNVAKHIQLNPEEELFFLSLLQEQKLKKRQLLGREHDVVKYLAFVTKGCLRAYSIDQNGFEHVLQFAPADWWIGDMYSLISQNEGDLTIDAIEDSEVFLLTRENQLKLFDEVPKFERFFRIILEKALVSSRQRLMDNLSLTAEQRYASFCKYYPSLIHELPQKQIAAFIGVTPEFLSKMKSRLLKKK